MKIDMKIMDLTVNQLVRPLGYDFSHLTLNWKVEDRGAHFSRAVRIWIWSGESREAAEYDTGIMEGFRECVYYPKLELKPETRYFWQVWAEDEKGREAESEVSWFETGRCGETWTASWIGTSEDEGRMPVLYKDFYLDGEIGRARLYMFGAGLYEAYVNGEKVGDEYLQPGYHSYDLLMEYQTWDLTGLLRRGKNRLEILLGEGWYKGRFGFDGDYRNLYGSRKMCIAQLHLTYLDGREEELLTDRTWRGRQSHVMGNGIYDGEWIDATLPCGEMRVEELQGHTELLTERTNPPIRKVAGYEPAAVTEHGDGYLLLDFGEAITGWVEWKGKLERKQRIRLSYGETLQAGNFYNENLRTAKAEFVYISDGADREVRPHFTYYGFRYVKVEGLREGQRLTFTAYRLMSDIKRTGGIVTSDERINRLVENTQRSQECNFLDIPTDCPQRDERMGWTGDVAVFARTACFHKNCGAFFRHYARSLYKEQLLGEGEIPFFSPRPKIRERDGGNPFYFTGGACGWGDVAAILPWTLYEYYGDRELLREQYPMMCGWVDYITRQTRRGGTAGLWQNGRHLGDWLALDNGNPDDPIGRTDRDLLASAYYYYSAGLCARAAGVLGDRREEEFRLLAFGIKKAFIHRYYDGKLDLNVEQTQTACAVLLFLGLYPEGGGELLAKCLGKLLEKNGGHLNTGFIGTPVLCPALSDNGMSEAAYSLLLREDYPGWLHEVKLGATTVWERWNSLNEDGTVNGTGMNSLNHYAYGSIADWIYRYMCGFRPSMGEDVRMTIKPMPDRRFRMVTGCWESVYGRFVCGWTYDGEAGFRYRIEVPFNANARAVFPGGKSHLLTSGEYFFDGDGNFSTAGG